MIPLRCNLDVDDVYMCIYLFYINGKLQKHHRRANSICSLAHTRTQCWECCGKNGKNSSSSTAEEMYIESAKATTTTTADCALCTMYVSDMKVI